MTAQVPMNVRVSQEFLAEFDAEATRLGVTRSDLARLKFGLEVELPAVEPGVELPAELMGLIEGAAKLAGYDTPDGWIADVLEAHVHKQLAEAQHRAGTLVDRDVIMLGVQRYRPFEVAQRGCKHPPQAREIRRQHTMCTLCGAELRKL